MNIFVRTRVFLQCAENRIMNWLSRIATHRIYGSKQKFFYTDIEEDTVNNVNYRKVLFTSKSLQLVLMCLRPKEEIGFETHDVDQFFRIERGKGEAVVDGVSRLVSDGDVIVVPAGVKHNIINASEDDLKLYSIYSPPQHKRGVVHRTKSDETEEHFDGQTD